MGVKKKKRERKKEEGTKTRIYRLKYLGKTLIGSRSGQKWLCIAEGKLLQKPLLPWAFFPAPNLMQRICQ